MKSCKSLASDGEVLFEGEKWLSVSLEGFSQQNAARPKEHLVKELVQNSLDAVGETGIGGRVELEIIPEEGGGCIVRCSDDGGGVDDMENLRTVFWTSKHDSRFKRGRMGRGFKELLSLCRSCRVYSGKKVAVFERDGSGNEKFAVLQRSKEVRGTDVEMHIEGSSGEFETLLTSYFRTFLVPSDVRFLVCGELVVPKKSEKVVSGVLTTEEFSLGKWTRPRGKCDVELIRCPKGETGLVYEMGIPVCEVEWDAPYHVNVLQRVPMNPNRDATMSGYVSQIHRLCLPHIIDALSPEKARAAWVGEAASKCSDKALQKTVLSKAFGDNLARSVPDFGKFSHDADAQEHSGVSILDTRQLTGGFRDLAKKHIPTSSEIVREANLVKRKRALEDGVDFSSAKKRYQQLVMKRGEAKIRHALDFYKWMADGILASIFTHKPVRCRVKLADFQGLAEATWTDQFQTLTLALDLDRIWDDPSHRENFALIVHETAHELAAHHGRSFSSAMETTAGAACSFLFLNSERISQWNFGS